MDRYMVHLENQGFSVGDARELLKKAKSLAINNAIIRDARVASAHIEFDVGIEKEEIDKLLDKFKKIAPIKRCIEITERDMSKDEAVEYARILFNEERYWEAHEVLEGVWKDSNGDEKLTVQGIILVCAALVHMQKDDNEVGYAILKRALPKLVMDKYKEIDVRMIKNKAEEMITNKRVEFFKI